MLRSIQYALRLGSGGVLLALLCFCASCRQPAPPSTGLRLTFTDELNRQVAIAPNPQRIISLAPNITEMLFVLGMGERVVAVTSYCDFPPEAKNKERIGDTLQPNLERIIALRPDLVVITTASQVERLSQQLDQLSIPVYVTNPRTVRDVPRSLRRLGEVTGVKAQAEELAVKLEERIRQVEARVASQTKPRVLFVLQLGPLITAGRNTFINDLITLAGGESISGAETTEYPQFSLETAVARTPEVIIAPLMHGSGAIEETALRRAFATTPAVRQERLVRISPDLTSRPGPRLIDGLEQLAEALHPAQPPKP
jgi:iron complex transport system substrate-binding protein